MSPATAAIVGVLLSAPTPSEQKEAFALADKAEKFRAKGDLKRAREALAQAYALDPNPYFLFGRGRLAAEDGDCSAAVELLQDFLDKHPTADGTADAEAEIEKCGGTVAVVEEPEPPPPEPPPPVVEPPPITDPVVPTKKWHRDPLGGVLLGIGLAGVVTGVGLYAGAAAQRDAAPEAETTDGFRRSVTRTRALETGGIIAFAVGGSLIVGAIVRYVVVSRKGSTARTSAATAAGRRLRP